MKLECSWLLLIRWTGTLSYLWKGSPNAFWPQLPTWHVQWWAGCNYYFVGMGIYLLHGVFYLWFASFMGTYTFCTVLLAFSSNWAFANGMFVTKSTLLHCTIHVLKSLYLIHICILMSPEMHSQNRTVPYLLNILSFRIFAFSVLIRMA